jgi:hypothetical protein
MKKPMVVGTKLFSSEKIYGWGKKTKDVGNKSIVEIKNKNEGN